MIALLATVALAAEPALLADALEAELQRQLADLSLPDADPIYHLRYKLLMLEQADIQATQGALVGRSTEPYNGLGVELRIGGPEFDNTGFGGWQDGFQQGSLPLDPSPLSVRRAAWRLTDRAFKDGVEQLSRKEAQFAPPADYPGDYQLLGPTRDEAASPAIGDRDALETLARTVSGALGGMPALDGSEVWLGHEAGLLWIVDSEGTRVARPVHETSIRAMAWGRTADGLLLTDDVAWSVQDPSQLPSVEAMADEVRTMGQGLAALTEAPRFADEYVGPVLFEGEAAGDLFRYLLVPQLEGTPPDVPFDSFFGDLGASADPARLSRRVLPEGWRVVDDPTADLSHPGGYVHDWEGTPASRVDLVVDGIVRDLAMSRVPRKGTDGTNGHGRGGLSERARGKLSLVQVDAAQSVSQRALRKRALRLASAYGRDWVLVVRALQEPAVRTPASDGTWYMDEDLDLPPPVSVVRLYADGREEVAVGASFSGVERWVLRDIVAAGPPVERTWLAPLDGGWSSASPTGGAPTRVLGHEVLVGEMELVPMGGDPSEVPVLGVR